MIIDESDYLMHYGILRKSGRYPWGSGGNTLTRSMSFLDTIAYLKSQGMSEADIAKSYHTKEHPFTTTDLRALKSIANAEKKAADISTAIKLKAKGMSNVEIGKAMGRNESSIRSLLAASQKEETNILKTVSDKIKEQVDKKGFVDIGVGVENHIGVSKDRLATAVAMLRAQGYEMHKVQVDQIGTPNKTIIKVLAPPGTKYKDIVTNMDKIHQMDDVASVDGGRTFDKFYPPLAISSKRVGVRYKEDGGADADGVIYVRPGKEDVSLGKSRYAQVRVNVDGTHYLKGMAMYKDDLPPGVDLVFNTNKSNTGNKLDAMKEIKKGEDGKIDKENPFGAIVRQIGPRDEKNQLLGVSSAMNLVNEQGDWEKWKKTISRQVLSKQSPKLAKEQLDMMYERKKNEFDSILALTNPAVRRTLLEKFSDDADSSAVHMKAAALPRQRSHVILPINSMKPTEVYAPNYNNGERVVLIRYPHGGVFEIPELTVNNKHREAKSLIGMAEDAIGINHEVANRLSGADFDGDTVLVIPNRDQIKTRAPLEKLKNFDPQNAYKGYEGMPKMTPREKGQQMGLVSNLITDMTIRGASWDEIAKAVRHSMVVIDAEKHGLNWKQSAKDNSISHLMKKYQDNPQGGASTLISRATARTDVPKKTRRPAKEGGFIDKATGKKMWVPTGEQYPKTTVSKRTGVATTKMVTRTVRSQKLAETDNAHSLVSKINHPIEKVYADHSNRLKSLANEARRESVNTKSIPYSPSARKTYANEVSSLQSKLNLALMNAPLERQAQLIANTTLAAKRQAAPEMDNAQLKKVKFQSLEDARNRTGAGKVRIALEPREWEAIQAGAITNNMLTDILKHSDIERVKELATPRHKVLMTASKLSRAADMLAKGYTQAEVAANLGVSLTTLKEGMKDG